MPLPPQLAIEKPSAAFCACEPKRASASRGCERSVLECPAWLRALSTRTPHVVAPAQYTNGMNRLRDAMNRPYSAPSDASNACSSTCAR